MLFTTETISNKEIKSINNFFNEFESVEDIANTKIGNKIVRKRNLQQVMRESFFYGANRFGNNFIA